MKALSLLALVMASSHLFAADVITIDPALRQRAIEESATPVREGVPHWNQNAVQFQFAPCFDFRAVPEARRYRFSIQPAKGEALVFTADKPTTSLAPIWTQLSTGKATLTVRELDAKGHEFGEAMTRSFHRAAVIPNRMPRRLCHGRKAPAWLSMRWCIRPI